MQHALTVLTYPGSGKTCFFCIPVLGRKSFLIFPIIYLRSDLHIDLVNPFIFGNSCPGWHNYSLWGLLFQFHGQLTFKFHWVKMCFLLACINSVDITNCIEITQSVMSKPVYLLTVQEAHKEYNSLMDQIWAKYEQLDSGKFGAVDTLAFNTEACELANLIANVSQLCQKLNLLPPKELYRPTFFKHWRALFGSKWHAGSLVRVWRMQLCYHRYVRITRLLSAPLVNFRIMDWLCILPAMIVVVDKSKKVNKASLSDWWTAKPTR